MNILKKSLIILILLIGFFLRVYELGEVPLSLDWDEVSMGYNAYSLLLTGNDEYGNSWPLSIRSFNDFKPPLYTYLIIPALIPFGLTEFAVRLPSAIFGTLTIYGVYLLAKQFFIKNQQLKNTPLLTAALFAISPWSLQFSRTAFEANIAVCFVVYGMALLLKYFNTAKPIYCYASGIVLSIALYAYHAPRLIVPLLLLATSIRYWHFIRSHLKHIITTTVIGLVLVAPLIIVLSRGGVAARAASVSVFKPTTEILRTLDYARQDQENGNPLAILHNRRVSYVKTIIQGYLDHFYPVSIFIKGDVVGRHHPPSMGHLYFIEFPFIIIGLIYLIKHKFNFKFLFFFWLLVAPIPAALATGTPHAIRSILFLPLPQIITAIGILASLQALSTFKQYPWIKTAALTVIVFAYFTNFAYYLNQYYVHQNAEYANQWQYGYKQLIEYLDPIEQNYDKIIITPAWDQPYIYFLFYKYQKYDPRYWINPGDFNQGFDKYEFRKINWSEDRKIPNTLLVGAPGEIPENEPGTINVIKFPRVKDGDVFRIYDDFKY